MKGWAISIASLLMPLPWLVVPAFARAVPPLIETPAAPHKLTPLIDAYFRSPDKEQRDTLANEIAKTAGGSISTVADAVRHAQLWPPVNEKEGSFVARARSGSNIPVAYQLPQPYDPTHRYPMIVYLLPGSESKKRSLADVSDASFAQLTLTLRNQVGSTFIQLFPTTRFDPSLFGSAELSAGIQAVLKQARRLFHTDTDRVFLWGSGKPGDAVWMASLTDADPFAGLIVLSGYPHLPYPAQSYRWILENLTNTTVFSVWLSTPDDTGQSKRARIVSAHNRAIAAVAGELSLPVVGREVRRPADEKKILEPLKQFLAQRRPPASRVVSRWFRYPEQGRVGWLSQEQFLGKVWDADQLSVVAAPGTDRDSFISQTIQDRMAYLSGRIDGQTLTIEARHCGRVAVSIPEGLVDWRKTVIIRCNGTRRFHGRITASTKTLLETAYRDWEFQRLTWATHAMTIHRRQGS